MIKKLIELVQRWKLSRLQIDENAKCPYCGHFGCVLRAVPPKLEPVGDGKEKRPTYKIVSAACVERVCKTCGGVVAEDTVAPQSAFVKEKELRA